MNDTLEIFVSPSGNDDWSGHLREPSGDDGPVATLSAAFRIVREFRSTSTKSSVVVLVGPVDVSESILLGPTDAGTCGIPLTVKSANESAALTACFDGPTLAIRNTSHIQINGLCVQNPSGTGIEITDSSHITVSNVTVRQVESGITIRGGSGNTVRNSEINEVSGTAIEAGGGDRKTLTRCDHAITDNHIHHFGEASANNRAGVILSGVGIRLANNHIAEGMHHTIHLTGNEHTIENNHIHDVCKSGSGLGVVYMGTDWTERGITIRHNRIHDIGDGNYALYFDDCASGAVVQGNLFHDCSGAIRIGGGRNHRITNNIFVECGPAITLDGRAMIESEETDRKITQIMKPKFEAMNPMEPPYSIRYPDLREVAAYYFHERPIPPEGNLINRNICVGDWLEVVDPATHGVLAIQNNFTEGDPGFADLERRDFRLDEDAEVYELGFKHIPLHDIGQTAPVEEQSRKAGKQEKIR